MAAKKQAAKGAAKKGTRRRRGPAAPTGPEAREMAIDPAGPELTALAEKVRQSGGAVIGAYHDPFAGRPLLVASLPLKKVVETPFQRELSRTHAQRLSKAIGDAGVFLDPIIAIPSDEGFHSPNGRHRLAAAKALGMRAVTALLTPDPSLAYRILVLNTEKAHNLRDRAVEVIRMARKLAIDQPRSTEKDHEIAFEAPFLLTLGVCYEARSRFPGSSYQPMLRRVERFLDGPLPAALRQRDQWGQRILDVDERASEHVAALQKIGFRSPYLRTFVVARCNPVRFIAASRKKDAAPPMSMAEALTRMAANVRKFDPSKVRPQDLALVAAVAPPAEEE